MVWEKILEGLAWGLFAVAALLPVAAFSIAWSWLEPALRKPKGNIEELLTSFEELPELPEIEVEPELEEPEEPMYKYTPSTIVRPPNVIKRKDDDD